MSSKNTLISYLIVLILLVAAPLNGFNTALNNTTVIYLRPDYLMHALLFLPLALLWQLSFPGHRLWLVLIIGLFLAASLEGLQYLLPYRAWNVNDLMSNGVGVALGMGLCWAAGYVRSEKNISRAKAQRR